METRSTLRLMEQRVHTLRQTSVTDSEDGVSDFRSEVHVGVDRITVDRRRVVGTIGSVHADGSAQDPVLVSPALVVGTLIGIGAAIIVAAAGGQPAEVALSYLVPVLSGVFITLLQRTLRRRQQRSDPARRRPGAD